MFLHVSVCPQGGRAWQGDMPGRGACLAGGMCGRGHVWQRACVAGGMRGRGHTWQGACVAGGMRGRGHVWWGGMCGRGHAWQGGMARMPTQQIPRDTANERAVRTLLKCILVIQCFFGLL